MKELYTKTLQVPKPNLTLSIKSFQVKNPSANQPCLGGHGGYTWVGITYWTKAGGAQI